MIQRPMLAERLFAACPTGRIGYSGEIVASLSGKVTLGSSRRAAPGGEHVPIVEAQRCGQTPCPGFEHPTALARARQVSTFRR
jgi:hypothetical protein